MEESLDNEFSERDQFDDMSYLRLYPDVAKAVAEGQTSAWDHYYKHGRTEGRKLNDFDPEFYLRVYPVVTSETAAGKASSPFDHYRTIGRARGFLSNYKAQRPPNAALLSPYGGFWPDQANGKDVLQRKFDIGQITERQAEKLIFWMQNGYVILEHAIPDSLIDKALPDFDRAYNGGFTDLRFECPEVSRYPGPVATEHQSSCRQGGGHPPFLTGNPRVGVLRRDHGVLGSRLRVEDIRIAGPWVSAWFSAGRTPRLCLRGLYHSSPIRCKLDCLGGRYTRSR
jgi:hypothetical protein